MVDAAARLVERQKYIHSYDEPGYRMGALRIRDAKRDLDSVPYRGSYLDVSCGRGEMLDYAESLGFKRVQGTEYIPGLLNQPRIVHAEAHRLPFSAGEFEVVSLYDVLEHLVPGDDEAACRELQRVASKTIFITANNQPSRNHLGEDLHINIRSYDDWHACFYDWFSGCKIARIDTRTYLSAAWRICINDASL